MNQIVRRTVGHAVNLIGWFTRPEQIQRSEQERKQFAPLLKGLRIYDYKGCPSSLKLRHALHRLNLDIEYCDIRKCQVHCDNLLAQYGRLHAPCLRIEENQAVRWLDEPDQIIHYLEQRFAPVTTEALSA
jgi:glutaredoxin